MEEPSTTVDTLSVERCHFLKSPFKTGNQIILNTLKDVISGVIIIDEVGKLKLKSQGLYNSAVRAINTSVNSSQLHVTLAIRFSLLLSMTEKPNIPQY